MFMPINFSSTISGVSVPGSFPPPPPQIDLARHHTSFLPNSMNTRVPLGHQQQQATQTTTVSQLSTFPPAPLMFAATNPMNTHGTQVTDAPNSLHGVHPSAAATSTAPGLMATTGSGNFAA